MSPIAKNVLSDLFINIAAGWCGVIFISPFFGSDYLLLLSRIVFAMVFLCGGYSLRKGAIR